MDKNNYSFADWYNNILQLSFTDGLCVTSVTSMSELVEAFDIGIKPADFWTTLKDNHYAKEEY